MLVRKKSGIIICLEHVFYLHFFCSDNKSRYTNEHVYVFTKGSTMGVYTIVFGNCIATVNVENGFELTTHEWLRNCGHLNSVVHKQCDNVGCINYVSTVIEQQMSIMRSDVFDVPSTTI